MTFSGTPYQRKGVLAGATSSTTYQQTVSRRAQTPWTARTILETLTRPDLQAIHHLTTFLVNAAGRSVAVRHLPDQSGRTRVIVPTVGFSTHLKVVCGHIRQGGLERHPRVTLELLRVLGAVAEGSVGDRRRAAVAGELDLVLADARRMIPNSGDLDEVLNGAAPICAALERSRQQMVTTPAVLTDQLRTESNRNSCVHHHELCRDPVLIVDRRRVGP